VFFLYTISRSAVKQSNRILLFEIGQGKVYAFEDFHILNKP